MPGTLDWYALRGDSLRLLTTVSTDAFARRALAIDEALLDLQPLPLSSRVEPIDVVVQPVTVVPNGFVGLEPFRSYLYATPPQQQTLLGSAPWADLLAIHEYRHVEQYNALNRGVTRALDLVFRDGGRAAAMGLSTPDWFFEGDAVYYETALTYAGRGRAPSFTEVQRAQALAGVLPRYRVARNGSLRRRVTDHYPLGHAMIAHGRHAYGDPWPAVARGAGNFWPPLYPFSRALKRATGLRTPAFYRAAFDSLQTLWRARAAARTPTPHERLTPAGRQIPIYGSPLPGVPDAAGDGRPELLAVRSTRRRIPELVRVGTADGTVSRVLPTGIRLDGSLSYANRRAVWTELRQNPRRPNEDFAVLVRYDFHTGRRTRLTSATRLFGPGLSPDGNRVVAVELLSGEPPRLVFFDANTGRRSGALEGAAFELLAHPRFTPDGAGVVVLAKDAGGWLTYLRVDDLPAPAAEPAPAAADSPQLIGVPLVPWTRHTLGVPFPHGEHVYYASSYTGVDNVFRAPLDGTAAGSGGTIEQLTEASVSATQPSTDGERLYFVEVEHDGDPISALARADWLLRPVNPVEPHRLPKYAPLEPDGAAREFRDRFYAAERDPADDGLPSASRTAESGSVSGATLPADAERVGVLRGFSLYTLQPLADRTEASLTVYGGNVLADLSLEATAGYNLNERRGFGAAELTIARTWPWVTAGFGLAERSVRSLVFGDTALLFPTRTFEQRSFSLGLEAPLRQQAAAYGLSLTPRLAARYLQFGADDGDQLPGDESLLAFDFSVRAQAVQRQAAKHILPRSGVVASMRHRASLTGPDASQFVAELGLLLPGVLRSHTLYLRGNLRREDPTDAYQFTDFFRYARGVGSLLHESSTGLSADYHLPLWYPDVGVAGLVYALRLRAAVWVDYNRFVLPDRFRVRDYDAGSAGVDLVADLTLFDVQPLPLGVRLPYVWRADPFGQVDTGLGDPQLLVQLPF